MERSYGAKVLEEFEARAAEQVVLVLLLVGRVEHRSHEVVLDKEAVVEVVVSRDTRAKEAERSEAKVRMPGEARTRAEDARDGLGKGRIREDKVLRAEGVVGDKEAQKVAEMGEKRDLGGRHG